MAKAARIQDTIQLLCKIFADCGIPKISPETFRQAKFNKPEASECLWQFLFHVVAFIEHIRENTAEPFQSSKGKASPSLCVAKVKIFYYNIGYTRSEFYNTSYCSGSRESLLAFGWLLNEVQLLNLMRTYHLNQAHMENTETNVGYQLMISSLVDEVLQMEEECTDIDTKLKSGDELCDCIQKLGWLNGKICLSYRQLAHTYANLLKLISRLDKYSYNASRQNSISFYGWYLLMHPRELSRQLKKLEHTVTALHSIMDWQQHDKIFWKWMESVIDAQRKMEDKATSEEDEVKIKLPLVDSLHHEVNDLYKKLVAILSEKESQIKAIKQCWEMKLPQLDAVELKKERHCINRELRSSTIYCQILEQQIPVYYENHSVNINKLLPQFIYAPPTATKLHKPLLEQYSQLGKVEDETFKLKQHIAEIDKKLSLLRTEVETEFDKLISSRKLTAFCM